MSKLGGEFAVLIFITGDDAALSSLSESLPQMESALGVSCFAKRTATSTEASGGVPYAIRASGLDRPGIVEAVTQVLAQGNVNVTSFSSHIENAPLTGTPMFHLEAGVEFPPQTDEEIVRAQLTEACEQQGLEFSLSKLES
jgi:glycine cleavage system transcriptional repressor